MPLTRHLYREDEVAAALFWCILRGRAREACFWCLEMLDSGLADALLDVHRQAWLYGFGARCLGWLRAFEAAAAEDAIDPDAILGLTCALCRLGAHRDGTVLAFLGMEVAQPDRVAGETGETLEGFFAAAIAERRAAAAWMAARAAGEECEVWLERTLRERGRANTWDLLLQGTWAPWARRAVAVAAAALRDPEYAASWGIEPIIELPAEVADEIEAARAATGRRARRRFPIPIECLYWMTERGRSQTVYQSNDKELLRLERPAALWNSGYWDAAAEEHGGWEAVRSDDDAREAFYEAEFADDIPDEWSAKERGKSHGGGVLQPGAVARGTDWVRRMFAGRISSYLVWQGVEQCVLEAENLTAAWELPPVDASGWDLRGTGKRVLVAEN